MPALIFSNACQSARTEEWTLREYFQEEIFGLANAFVLAGVKHYIGTFWEILDEPSSKFALEFYKNLISGMTIGEAIRKARLTLIKQYGEETIVCFFKKDGRGRRGSCRELQVWKSTIKLRPGKIDTIMIGLAV